MDATQIRFQNIKSTVLQIVPDPEVTLFGSRAKGTANAESDWDILIITALGVNRELLYV